MLDVEIVKGWDAKGIQCWSGHVFSSWAFIEENSKHIGCVERTLVHGNKIEQNFRKYYNSDGKERFLMVDISNTAMVFEEIKVMAWITDAEFFHNFVNGMFKCGEIEEVDYKILMDSITQYKEKKGCGEISDDELEELEQL